MENQTQDEGSESQNLSSDEQFARWSQEHLRLQEQIEAIERRPHVTEEDELEEQRLKKQKLQLKDQMTEARSAQRKSAGA